MTSSADLPEGFLAEVFRNGCQCDHCVKWRAEIARLREAICEWVVADQRIWHSVENNHALFRGEMAKRDAAREALYLIAREER